MTVRQIEYWANIGINSAYNLHIIIKGCVHMRKAAKCLCIIFPPNFFTQFIIIIIYVGKFAYHVNLMLNDARGGSSFVS